MPSGGKPCPSGSQYSKQEKETCEEGKDLVKVVWFTEAVERLHQNSPRMGSPSVVLRGALVLPRNPFSCSLRCAAQPCSEFKCSLIISPMTCEASLVFCGSPPSNKCSRSAIWIT